MRVLSIHPNGTIGGGGDMVFIQGNRLLGEHGHKVAWFTIGKAPQAIENGQVTYCLPEFRTGNQIQKQIGLAAGHIFNPQAYKLARQAMHEFHPDVVHVHNIQGQLSPSVLLPFRRMNIPIVQTIHDYRLLCPAIHFLSNGQVCESCKGKRFYRCALKRCRRSEFFKSSVAALGSYVSDYLYQYDQLISAYIAPSEFMQKKMVEYGYAKYKIHILPNAYFGQIPRRATIIRKHILFVGRLSPEKGVDLLVRAAKGLNLKVYIAGDGPEYKRLHTLAKQTEANNVEFLGFLSSEKLSHLYQEALVTVLPSRWYENGPLTVLESYAHATPVIGARIGAIPEFVDENKTGFLFEPNNANELHTILQNYLSDPHSLNHMGCNALSIAKVKYSPQAYIDGLESLLNNVISQESYEHH
jgi:glycosyltransferase involved in cell wall biosynthesis